jgi:hypothetical protein
MNLPICIIFGKNNLSMIFNYNWKNYRHFTLIPKISEASIFYTSVKNPYRLLFKTEDNSMAIAQNICLV